MISIVENSELVLWVFLGAVGNASITSIKILYMVDKTDWRYIYPDLYRDIRKR